MMQNRKGPKKEKIPLTPGFGYLMSSQGHAQFSSRRDGFFSKYFFEVEECHNDELFLAYP